MRKLNNYDRFSKLQKLSYRAFDWDDNILHMPTKINMDKYVENSWIPLSVLPSEFAIVRNDKEYRIRDNDPYKAFLEFKDCGPRGDNSFMEDVKYSILNKQFGPSWDTFLKCLMEGSIFAIITARGHEYETIKNGVKYIIDKCLTHSQQNRMYNNCLGYSNIFEKGRQYKRTEGRFSDNELIMTYLDACKYFGVGAPFSESFKNEFDVNPNESIEVCKQLALGKFIDICNEYGRYSNLGVSIGFSDDDKRNVEHIKHYFESKSNDHINLRLTVFDTSDKNNGVKTKYSNGSVVENMGPSMANNDNSLLRFDQFNSQSRNLQNSTNDFTGYELQQRAKVGVNLYKKDFKKTKKKILKKKIGKATE